MVTTSAEHRNQALEPVPVAAEPGSSKSPIHDLRMRCVLADSYCASLARAFLLGRQRLTQPQAQRVAAHTGLITDSLITQ